MRNGGCCNRFSPAIVVSFFFRYNVFKLCLPVFAEYTCNLDGVCRQCSKKKKKKLYWHCFDVHWPWFIDHLYTIFFQVDWCWTSKRNCCAVDWLVRRHNHFLIRWMWRGDECNWLWWIRKQPNSGTYFFFVFDNIDFANFNLIVVYIVE